MNPEGIMAVIRALPDTSMAMSVLDRNKQTILLPKNNAAVSTCPGTTYVPVVPVQSVGTGPGVATGPSVGSGPSAEGKQHAVNSHGAQVVDGRYASVYQMAHCHVLPTSPPVQLTEFPPQRAELSKGQGNFEVGGFGSGETSGSPTRTTQSYRGAMNWPDKSVYTPRQSYHYEPDSFADSLRKYPSMSVERSAEIVERLINYTQMKTSSSQKCPSRGPASPTRSEMDRRSCVSASLRTSRVYEPDVNIKAKVLDESPTRDTCRKIDYESIELRKSLFGRNYDVRYIRDITRRAKESVKSVSTYPYNLPVCPPIRERYDHLPPKNNILSDIISINSVHMETQAEIPMVSKEVTTVPREQPSMRNVAVPLSPSSSHSDSAKLSDFQAISSTHFPEPDFKIRLSHKSIQTNAPENISLKRRKSVQTCISSIDIAKKKKVKSCRKTKSQEEIRVNDDLEEELLKMIKDLSDRSDVDSSLCYRNGLLKKLRKIYRMERNDRIKFKLGRCVKDQLYSSIDFKEFTNELSNELISKIEARNMFFNCHGPTRVMRADIVTAKSSDDKNVNELIKEWLDDIPIKQVDYLGRPVDKEHVLHAVASKIKCLMMDNISHDQCGPLKPELLDILEDVPIEINSRHKNCYISKIASNIVRKIRDVFSVNTPDRKRWQKAIYLNKNLRNNFRKESFAYTYIQPTDNELKHFVKQELKDFTTKFDVTICPSIEKEIQIELMDILIDSLLTLRYGEDEFIKEEILVMLSDFINISENEGIYFVNNLIYNFKDMLKELHTAEILPQKFIVLQNTLENSSELFEQSVEGITENDINSNLNEYTHQIIVQINEWMENIQGLSDVDTGFKQVVAQDLAGDIIDRQKYLNLNPSKRKSDVDELENLKYQIFKWINKLVGEHNLETIENASQLMQRIQSIPIPMLTRPVVTVLNMASCCKKPAESNPSEKRKASSPEESYNSKSNIPFENRRRSCPYAISFDSPRREQNKCCSAEVDTKNLGIMTEPGQYQIRPDIGDPRGSQPRAPRKTTYTETEMPEIPKTCPRSTSMSMVDRPRAEPSVIRRLSGPQSFSPNRNYKPAESKADAAPRPQSPDRPTPLCCVIEPKDPSPIIKQLNDDYDDYLKNWVSQIPIITSNPEEQLLIDKMRKGIYNGVWKARTKLEADPNAMDNQFYYHDVLDDELEELLDLLPQSYELTNNKQMLKNQLIDKTISISEQIFKASLFPSYKQQLIDNVGKHIPRKILGFTGSDLGKICEDIHKMNLAETYIMYTMYRNIDTVKACVYRKKLMKQVQEFIENLKKTLGKEAFHIDFKTYEDEIINALHTVPQPTDETMREEGDEVLIGFEIEQWFADLPLYVIEPGNKFELLSRKRYKETLAKIVHDLERKNDLANFEEELRHEIRRFMAKLPLREGEAENMPFMVEELVNRIKNRPQDLIVGSEKRRLMPLIDPYDYDEFSRDMPLCSSFSDDPRAKKAQVNESSYYVRDGEKIEAPCGAWGGQFVNQRDKVPDSKQQWKTLQEGTQQSRQSSQRPGSNQQSLHEVGAPQARQTSQHPDSKQRWVSLHDDEASFARQTEQRQYTSAQEPDCCQLPDVRDEAVKNQSIRRESLREQESRIRDDSIRREPSPSALGPEEPCISGTCADQAPYTEQKFMRRESPIPVQSPEPALQTSPYASRIQERRPSGGRACQGAYPESRREQSPSPRQQEPRTSGMYAGQAPAPVRRSYDNVQGDANRNEIPRSFSPGINTNVCPRAQESRRGSAYISQEQGLVSAPAQAGLEISTRPYDGLQPDAPQPSGSRQTPSGFSGQPVGYSTPQQNGQPPRASRPKKRPRKVDRPRRDAAKKRVELSESDDSESEEVKCRCMERIWRCRKKRPLYPPCDECDLDFPPCFPMRFPYPYYY